jgi:solute carrier family 25 protein 46
MGSVLVIKGLFVVTEACIAESTPLLRDMGSVKFSLDNLTKHMMLKGVALVVMTPFLCSSLMETVQSSVASEAPGVLDCLREGLHRAGHWQKARSSRLLPVWLLCGPSLVYGLLHYAFSSCVRSLSLWCYQQAALRQQNQNKGSDDSLHNELMASLLGNLTADVLLFPVETIIHRLYLQGTRTIIDNVDQTSTVMPVISDYDGFSDCYKSVLSEEGSSGLFKGFGALVLQYSLHFAVLKLTKLVLQQFVPSLKRI